MKAIKKMLKSKKGFTLIELVVVIAVLGMIAVVAVPKISGITEKAKTASDAQTLAVLNEAVERYEAETGEEVTKPKDKSVAQFLMDEKVIKSIKLDASGDVELPSGKKAKFNDTDKLFEEVNAE